MLKIGLQIHELIMREAYEELLPQAGISIKTDEIECEGLLSTHSQGKSHLPSLNLSSFLRPTRFLDVLSALENLPYSQQIFFCHFSLEFREKILKNLKTHSLKRLTEKECQLLRFFHQNKGQEITKERLLKEIWDYHPEAETHTLETHIYRLRQKLEEDPNNPEVLLNGKDGYLIQ